MTEYFPREINVLLEKALRQSPVVVVSGLRQTGKSSLLQREPLLVRKRTYRTFDDWAILEQGRSSPLSLLGEAQNLALDEVQRIPEIFLSLKQAVDQDRRAGRLVLTGSANLLLLKGISDSLAGRAVYARLHPFNRRELQRRVATAPALVRFLTTGHWPEPVLSPVTEHEVLRGGFPEVALNPRLDADLWFDGFERAYLERDVRDLRRIEDLMGFRRLLRLAALRVGNILNVNGLARDAGLSEPTTRRYLDLMETLLVIHRLPPFLGNRSSRLIKAPKLFFADSGLVAFLAGVKDIRSGAAEPLRGGIFENYVLQNLRSLLEPHLYASRLYYWNEQGRAEVDFILEAGRQLVAIEVKAAGRIGPSDWRGLGAFMAKAPQCAAGLLVYSGDRLLSFGEKKWAVPLSLLLA